MNPAVPLEMAAQHATDLRNQAEAARRGRKVRRAVRALARGRG
jgi:hypothetical protein